MLAPTILPSKMVSPSHYQFVILPHLARPAAPPGKIYLHFLNFYSLQNLHIPQLYKNKKRKENYFQKYFVKYYIEGIR